MRRFFAWCLASLPFDQRSRRAMNETLLDWAEEADQAHTVISRLVVDVANVLGVARTVTRTLWWETAAVPAGWLVRRLTVVVMPGAIAMGIPAALFAKDFGPAQWPSLVLPLVLAPVAVQLPASFFVAAAWPPTTRRVPFVGLALAGAAMTLLVFGWLIPLAFQAYREAMWEALAGLGVSAKPPAPGAAEMTISDLLRNGSDPTSVITSLTRTFGFALLAGSMTFLGGALEPRLRGRRRWWLLAALPTYMILGGTLTALTPSGFQPVAIWFVALAALYAATSLNLAAARSSAS